MIVMPKRGENIYKRKDGRWEGRYVMGTTESGRTKFGYVYARSYSEVKRVLSIARHNMSPQPNNVSKSYTGDLCDWTSKWLIKVQYSLKPSTFSRYSYIINKYIVPRIGSVKVEHITNNTINEFVNSLLTSGRADGNGGLSVKTVKSIANVLLLSLKDMCREGYSLTFVPEIRFPNVGAKVLPVLTQGTQLKIEQHILSVALPYNIGILICLYTGLRIGEVCALRWSDISLQEKTLTVSRTVQRIANTDPEIDSKTQIIISSPKTKNSVRTIPLPDCLLSSLRSLRINAKKSDCVLLSGNEYVEPRAYQYNFKSLLKKCGVEPMPFHSLRHSFATRCIEIGFDVKTLSEILGHSSVNITLNTYVHSSIKHKRTNMARLSLIHSYEPSNEPSQNLYDCAVL